LSLPKIQKPFRPCGWKGFFWRLTTHFAVFQAALASKKGLFATAKKPEKDLGKDKAGSAGAMQVEIS